MPAFGRDTRRPSFRWVVTLAIAVMGAAPAYAGDEPGQEELDAAVEAKLNAESISDLAEVIDHCNRALELGLNDENKDFAHKLLASALFQRGTAYAEAIFGEEAGGDRTIEQIIRLRELALEDLEHALELDGEQVEQWYLVARLHAFPGGDRQKAIDALEKLLKSEKIEAALRAKALTVRGSLAEKPEDRLADYSAALEAVPDEVDALRARGELLYEMKRLDEARADLEKALELDPESAETLILLSAILVDQNKIDDALKTLDKAIEQNPRAAQAYVQRARLLLQRNEAAAASEDLDRVLVLAPGNPVALLLRATARWQAGQNERAMEDVERILEQRADFAPALRLRGVMRAELGRLAGALEDLKLAAEIEPDDVELRLQVAMLELASKLPASAIADYSHVLKLDEKNVTAWQGRADAHLALGEQVEAIADYEQALKLAPESSAILNNLAWLLATSPEDSLRDGKRAIELATAACKVTDFKQAHILSTLAAGYAETGDFKTAIDWSTKAVELGEERNREALSKELESYQEGKPWRETLPPPAPEQPTTEVPASDEKPADAPQDDAPADDKPAAEKPADDTPRDGDDPVRR
ncbi:MAG: tetratricopeptide repeat protein [Pirellulales bacterium]|nr:tetratricopeptide repeat protein [Pirellulales bacterium]